MTFMVNPVFFAASLSLFIFLFFAHDISLDVSVKGISICLENHSGLLFNHADIWCHKELKPCKSQQVTIFQ